MTTDARTSLDDVTVIDEDGRPNFAAMVQALRGEADWVVQIHSGDKTGAAKGDAEALLRLADDVEALAKRLGYL